MKRFNYKKWVTENKYGLLLENVACDTRNNNPYTGVSATCPAVPGQGSQTCTANFPPGPTGFEGTCGPAMTTGGTPTGGNGRGPSLDREKEREIPGGGMRDNNEEYIISNNIYTTLSDENFPFRNSKRVREQKFGDDEDMVYRDREKFPSRTPLTDKPTIDKFGDEVSPMGGSSPVAPTNCDDATFGIGGCHAYKECGATGTGGTGNTVALYNGFNTNGWGSNTDMYNGFGAPNVGEIVEFTYDIPSQTTVKYEYVGSIPATPAMTIGGVGVTFSGFNTQQYCNPPVNTEHDCVNNVCTQVNGGQYPTLAACQQSGCGGTTTPHCHNIRAVNCRVEDIPGQQMMEELDCVTIGNNLVDLNNNKSYREGNGIPYTYQIGTPAQYFTNHSGYIMWEVIESTPEYDTTLPITNLDVGDCTPTGIIPNKKEPLPDVPDIREMIENSDNLMKKIVKKMLK